MPVKLAAHGYEVYATEGTATVLRAVGIEVAGVPAKVSEGTRRFEGTTTDLIRDGRVFMRSSTPCPETVCR